jgi:hypothetical protein
MLFIMGVCQWELLYEGLCVLSCTYKLSYVLCYLLWVCVSESICMKVCMSCPVYIVVRLILFHHGCVSVRESVWKFVCLVLYILSYVLCYFIMGVCQREHLYESLCVLYCIYCRTSYVISSWVCVSERVCIKVCMTGNDHLTWRGGGGFFFFLKKYSDSQCCWKKYSDFGGGKKT